MLIVFFSTFVLQAQETTDQQKTKTKSNNANDKYGSPIKGVGVVIKHNCQRGIYVSLNGNSSFSNGDNVSNSSRFNPSLGVNYIFGNNIILGLEGNYLTANQNLAFDSYATPLANNPAITTSNNNNSFNSTSLILNVGYSLKLKQAEKIRHQALNFMTGTGLVFNSYPE